MSFLIILITIAISIMIKYEVEGEKTLPFSITKILLVSTVDGNKVEDAENIWHIDVTQVNDMYMYIDKTSTEDKTIKQIQLENFHVYQMPQKGELKLLRPTGELSNLYSQSEQNYLTEGITYLGSTIDDMKSLEIGNTGGVIGFRMALMNLGAYVSNENTEVVYDGRLLSNLGIHQEEIHFKVSFDIIIETSDAIKFKGTIALDMPVDNVIEEGSTSIEITDFSNVIFKRMG